MSIITSSPRAVKLSWRDKRYKKRLIHSAPMHTPISLKALVMGNRPTCKYVDVP